MQPFFADAENVYLGYADVWIVPFLHTYVLVDVKSLRLVTTQDGDFQFFSLNILEQAAIKSLSYLVLLR